MWHPASTPPDGTPGHWTREVVVVTTLGHVYRLAYFPGEEDSGCWQRPAVARPGEAVAWWTELPPLP